MLHEYLINYITDFDEHNVTYIIKCTEYDKGFLVKLLIQTPMLIKNNTFSCKEIK